MKYFKDSDFNCPCCNKNEMDKAFLNRFDSARELAGVPFYVTSGYRCPSHNKTVGGNHKSSHMEGIAADLFIKDSSNRFRIIKGLLDAGFTRLGLQGSLIHVDGDIEKIQKVIW